MLELRALAQYYGAGLVDILQDWLDRGINDKIINNYIQWQLSSETDLTLQKALHIAQGLEAVAKKCPGNEDKWCDSVYQTCTEVHRVIPQKWHKALSDVLPMWQQRPLATSSGRGTTHLTNRFGNAGMFQLWQDGHCVRQYVMHLRGMQWLQ